MNKIVKILKVLRDIEKEKRDGSTYNCTSILYQDGAYEKETAIATAFLEKNTSLKAQVDALQDGQEAELVFEKKGIYNNLTQIVADKKNFSKPADKPAEFKRKSTFVDNSVGMQVGNALNNAAILVANKVVKTSLEDTAVDILKLGESLKQRLVDGEFAIQKKPPFEAKPESGAVVQDEDIDFGD